MDRIEAVSEIDSGVTYGTVATWARACGGINDGGPAVIHVDLNVAGDDTATTFGSFDSQLWVFSSSSSSSPLFTLLLSLFPCLSHSPLMMIWKYISKILAKKYSFCNNSAVSSIKEQHLNNYLYHLCLR